MTKQCKRCSKHKDISEFYFDKRRNSSVSPCKECRISKVREKNDSWRKNNRERYLESCKKSSIKRKYGLSHETLIELWKAQNKACAICHKPISLSAIDKSSKPHVDHCHVTNVVRGLLCLTCNTGLGMFGDSEDLLVSARNYLTRAKTSALGEYLSDSSASVSADTNTIH